jgi:hypothetical protein
VGIGVFVAVTVGITVSVGFGGGVKETPHAERKNITRIADKIFFKPNLLFAFKILCLEGCAQRFALAAVGRAWIKLQKQDSVRV